MRTRDDLVQIRVGRPAGERSWRSLRELASAPVQASGEFPAGAADPPTGLHRRTFLQLAGGAGALAAAGCQMDPPRKIVPYDRRPAGLVPGLPAFYATSMTLGGYAGGLLVESREGRPVKIEGNPDHPANLGATSLFQQAAIRQLYDDCRARRVRFEDQVSSWEDLFARLRAPRADRGSRLRIVMDATASPALLAALDRVWARHPEARVAFHEPLASGFDTDGTALAFGRRLLPQLDLTRAAAILSLDADFLSEHPFSVRYARQWAGRRRIASAAQTPARLSMVESQLSVTGSMADDRLRRPLERVPLVARAVAARMALPAAIAGAVRSAGAEDAETARWADAVARDLRDRPRGTTLVLAGDRQPPAVHALAHALNDLLGNIGHTIWFTQPVLPQPGGAVQTFAELAADLRASRVDTLLLLDTNPVYTAPADLGFGFGLDRVPETICLAAYEHETARRCRWFAPALHFLETWGDGRAHDGTVSMIQPLIRPLIDGRAPLELLAALAGDPQPDAHRLVHDFWVHQRGLDEAGWQRAVQRGLQPDTAAPAVEVKLEPAAVGRALASLPPPHEPAGGRIAVELYPSPTVHDGRFANNPWLLEQPAPIGKLTWDNAVQVSPATAQRLGVRDTDVVELHAAPASVRGPVQVIPGMADGVAAVWLGYGRTGQERHAAGVGFDAYPLRTRERLHSVPDVSVVRTGARRDLALTQEHWSTHDRPIALRRTLAQYRRQPDFAAPYRQPAPSFMPEYPYRGNQWAMSIDLSLCTGCGTCTVACQAENNLPVVGRDQVLKSREMNWLRIDTYFFGPPEAPRLVHQPMMCQHCEKAPCEYVCPVEATVHSPDGLNEMVYNRCVGTRFCSNNCPYKVRRFNWFDWGTRVEMNRGLVELQFNPDVTVRERGVMEKCTYCVQRIRRAEIRATVDKRTFEPREVVTACAAACPTGAIQFGSLADRGSTMVRWRQEDRAYAVLQAEEGTQPRTHYLARIDDPNPEIG